MPFGYIETPLNNSVGVVGAVPVTGWALDDIEVVKVDIWRNPMPLEPVRPNGLVYIGDAIFSEGARPDVEAVYATLPVGVPGGVGVSDVDQLPAERGERGISDFSVRVRSGGACGVAGDQHHHL